MKRAVVFLVLCLSLAGSSLAAQAAETPTCWFLVENDSLRICARGSIKMENGRRISVNDFFDRAKSVPRHPGLTVMCLPVTLRAKVPYLVNATGLSFLADGRWYTAVGWLREGDTSIVINTEEGRDILFLVPAINPDKIVAMRFTLMEGKILEMKLVSKL